MKNVDLRSDTVTRPTPEMREAMCRADVGDDVYGEDPTVNKLQELAATMLGKEAGLFVPSGTMGNLSAMLAHCQRGDEVILGNKAHTFLYESGGISALGGVHSCQLPNQSDGSLALEEIKNAIRADDPHQPITRLIALENTHNRCGGTYQVPAYTQEICDFAHLNGLAVHLDGARIFNAATACGMPVKAMVDSVDSVTFCLSKGLCAPVGSILCGSNEFIRKAHRIRKQLGGGMRQAGILAAAGIIALESMVERLKDDHARARCLADGLRQYPYIILDNGTAATNMVFLSVSDEVKHSTRQISSLLEKQGVRVGAVGEKRFRLVTHYWIDDEDINHTIEAFGMIKK
ncbi:MAG: threonine aldolase [Chloroflexi bacterium GWB2_49_20]|nr:MAG: threonine aldolase [Chloroflexi bacterium GWB2_49_20]OGN78230.1 MAG: threonine aldolase [Chloroflexi bacterium GWC2_49_37]OGN85266.1 MAG: threonine aldolase [Chloroflexi bacterium GWD2_49_16]